MRIDLLSIFPQYFAALDLSLMGKARASRAREKITPICGALREVGRKLLFVALVRNFTDC